MNQLREFEWLARSTRELRGRPLPLYAIEVTMARVNIENEASVFEHCDTRNELHFHNTFNSVVHLLREGSDQKIFLFDSVLAAEEASFMLRGQWDNCNVFVFLSLIT